MATGTDRTMEHRLGEQPRTCCSLGSAQQREREATDPAAGKTRLHFPGRSPSSKCFPLATKKTLLHPPPKGICSWPAPTAFGSGFLALSGLLDTSQACKPLVWPNGSRISSRGAQGNRKQRVPAGEHTVPALPCSQAGPGTAQGESGHIVLPAQPAWGTGNIPAFPRSQQQHGNWACSPAGEMRSLPPGEGTLKLTGQVVVTAGLRIPNKSFLLGSGTGFPEKLWIFQPFKGPRTGCMEL